MITLRTRFSTTIPCKSIQTVQINKIENNNIEYFNIPFGFLQNAYYTKVHTILKSMKYTELN